MQARLVNFDKDGQARVNKQIRSVKLDAIRSDLHKALSDMTALAAWMGHSDDTEFKEAFIVARFAAKGLARKYVEFFNVVTNEEEEIPNGS